MGEPSKQTNGRLEEAITDLARGQAALAQAQATLVANQAAFIAQARETDKRIGELDRITAERFARIEALLLEHNRMLLALPDAVREKIGFKTPVT